MANHRSRCCEDPWGAAVKPRNSFDCSDQDVGCSSDLGSPQCCHPSVLAHGSKSFSLSGFAYKSFAGVGGTRGLLWWLLFAVLAVILTTEIYFSGVVRLDCVADAPLHVTRSTPLPAWKETAPAQSSANPPESIPFRQFLLRRTAWGGGGSGSLAPWRLWGCRFGGSKAQIAEVIAPDAVVVDTSAEAEGEWDGGSGEVAGEGAESKSLEEGAEVEGQKVSKTTASNGGGEMGEEGQKERTRLNDGRNDGGRLDAKTEGSDHALGEKGMLKEQATGGRDSEAAGDKAAAVVNAPELAALSKSATAEESRLSETIEEESSVGESLAAEASTTAGTAVADSTTKEISAVEESTTEKHLAAEESAIQENSTAEESAAGESPAAEASTTEGIAAATEENSAAEESATENSLAEESAAGESPAAGDSTAAVRESPLAEPMDSTPSALANPPQQLNTSLEAHSPEPSTHGVDIFFKGEFGYELIAVLPFAYWHHLNGSLRSTTSCGRHSLASLYYFSPNHTDDATCQRDDMKDNVTDYGFPGGIHYSRIPPAWQPPPLAEHFRKLPPVWPEISKGSRLVVIGNKFEREWGHSPINFIDIPTLLKIVNSYLEAGFYVVYNNPGMSLEQDHRQIVKNGKDLGDYEALQEQFGQNQRFQVMQNVQKRWPDLGFNDVQFRMLATSVCFVSVQGGGSIVESFFGGRNVIFFREGQEMKGRAYEKIYPRLSGANIKVVTSYTALERKVDRMIQRYNCYAQV